MDRNGYGLQMDGFSAHFEPSWSIFDDINDFGDFAIASGGLPCFRKVPGPSESALKVPEPCENVLWWSDAASESSTDPPGLP